MSTTNRKPQQSKNRGGRRMEFMASVSRSSGLEKDGDALKNYKTQEEYWQFVKTKLDDYWAKYPLEAPSSEKNRDDARHGVLILFRKLREGILASKRLDRFALEVYEISLHVSTIFESHVHTVATLAYLVSNFCTSEPTLGQSTILISLLHRMMSTFPSQTKFRDQLNSLPPALFPKDSAQYIWVSALASALSSCNYTRAEQLTRDSYYLPLLETLKEDLATVAVRTLIDSTRSKIRERSWLVIRTAYREITCASNSADSSDWLERSLLLSTSTRRYTVEDWMKGQAEAGHVKLKEGTQGKWIISKPK